MLMWARTSHVEEDRWTTAKYGNVAKWPTALPGLGRGDSIERVPEIRQYQIVQTAIDQIEIRLVQPTPFDADEERRLIDHVCNSLGYPFKTRIRYADQIERSPNGKYEEFLSLL